MFIFEERLKGSSYRFERKYLIKDISFEEVKLACLLHPKCFRPIYQPRTINNIYFDTFGFDYYTDNVEGEKNRLKARIRWYGELLGPIKKPVLELKIKKGMLGTKDSYRLAPFNMDGSFSREAIRLSLEDSDTPEFIKNGLINLQPTILNQYHRHYFASFDNKFRLTIDSRLRFHKVSYTNPVALEHSPNRNTIILEMKYAEKDDNEARNISSLFPFPLTKSSKYIDGIERLYDALA